MDTSDNNGISEEFNSNLNSCFHIDSLGSKGVDMFVQFIRFLPIILSELMSEICLHMITDAYEFYTCNYKEMHSCKLHFEQR